MLFLSCSDNKEKEEPDGGPCSYETKIYPATVIKIEIGDSLYIDILFRVDDEFGNLYKDSVSWYMENKNWLSISEINKDSISLGKKYQFLIDEIKTGACNPFIEKLTLLKYEKY